MKQCPVGLMLMISSMISLAAVASPDADTVLQQFVAESKALDVRLKALESKSEWTVTDHENARSLDEQVQLLSRSVPMAMDETLEEALIRLYANLDGRSAFIRSRRHLPDMMGNDEQAMAVCIGRGAHLSERFPTDAAAVLERWQTTKRLSWDRSSIRAGKLAVRLATVQLTNRGCGACGGNGYGEPHTVDWEKKLIDGRVQFRAEYFRGRWDVVIVAC